MMNILFNIGYNEKYAPKFHIESQVKKKDVNISKFSALE